MKTFLANFDHKPTINTDSYRQPPQAINRKKKALKEIFKSLLSQGFTKADLESAIKDISD